MCRAIISLRKITHQLEQDHTRQQKEQGLEVGHWSQWGRVGWTKFEIWGR